VHFEQQWAVSGVVVHMAQSGTARTFVHHARTDKIFRGHPLRCAVPHPPHQAAGLRHTPGLSTAIDAWRHSHGGIRKAKSLANNTTVPYYEYRLCKQRVYIFGTIFLEPMLDGHTLHPKKKPISPIAVQTKVGTQHYLLVGIRDLRPQR
jgi:hypothetical protein